MLGKGGLVQPQQQQVGAVLRHGQSALSSERLHVLIACLTQEGLQLARSGGLMTLATLVRPFQPTGSQRAAVYLDVVLGNAGRRAGPGRVGVPAEVSLLSTQAEL